MRVMKGAGIGGLVLFAASLSADAASLRDNYIYFAIAGLQSFSFSATGYNITPKQPYNGATSGVSKSGEQAFINVRAGRKKSTQVANWFKQQVGAGQTLVCDSAGTYPTDLNFAVQGTLNVTLVDGTSVTCDNVIVAQGHFGSDNNWWMGGPQMKGVHISFSGGTIQACKAKGKVTSIEVIFTPQTPCVNHFNIAVGLLR